MNPSIRTALGGCLALAAAMGVGRFVYTPILPAMTAELGLTAFQAGMIASANFAGYLVGAVAAASRFLSGSRRQWLFVALVLNAVVLFFMGLTDVTAHHLMLRFANGVASAFVLVFASSLVISQSEIEPRYDASWLHFSGVGLGVAISAIVVAAMQDSGADWRALWRASGYIGFGAIVAVVLLIKPHRTQTSTTAAPIGHAITSGLPRLIIAYGLFGFGYVITATFIVHIVRHSSSLAAVESWVWLTFGLGAIPAVLMWNLVAKRHGVLSAFAIACLTQSFAVAVSALAPSPEGIILSAFLLGSTVMGITALGITAARSMSSNIRRSVALMTTSFGVGQIIGPVFAGIAADYTGSFVLPSLTAAVALIVSALLVVRPSIIRANTA